MNTEDMKRLAEELLPCPFCGYTARIVRARRTDPAMVTCNGPGCTLHNAFYDEADAIAAWNRRTAPPESAPTEAPTPIELIARERSRQVAQEDRTLAHDDEHTDGELADAAACYAAPEIFRDSTISGVPRAWPFDAASWKPTPDDRVRELVKAGALIVAEIERLQRASPEPDRELCALACDWADRAHFAADHPAADPAVVPEPMERPIYTNCNGRMCGNLDAIEALAAAVHKAEEERDAALMQADLNKRIGDGFSIALNVAEEKLAASAQVSEWLDSSDASTLLREIAALQSTLREREEQLQAARDEVLFPPRAKFVSADLPGFWPDAPPTLQLRRETVDEFRAAFGTALRQLSRITGLAWDALSPLSVAGKAYEIEQLRAEVEELRRAKG